MMIARFEGDGAYQFQVGTPFHLVAANERQAYVDECRRTLVDFHNIGEPLPSLLKVANWKPGDEP